MSTSDTATPDAKAAFEAEFDALGAEQEDEAPADGGNATTDEAPDASPATAETDAEAGPEGSADEAVEAQPEGAAKPAEKAPDSTGQPAPQPQYKPYVARADGKDIRIPGAVRVNGYIAIPEAQERLLQSHLADRDAWIVKERAYKAQIEAKGEKETEATVLIEHLASLMEGDGSGLRAFFENFDVNRAALLKEMENAGLKERLSAREKQDQESQREQEDRAYQEWAPKALREAVGGFLGSPEFKDSGLKSEVVVRKLERLGDGLFFRATEDMPDFGVRKGQIGVRYDMIAEMMRDDADMLKTERTTRAEAEEAKKRNAAATGKTATKAPPALTAKGSPTPGGKTTKKPATQDEWDEDFANFKL